ncbi:MAG TPA: BamA/TamA family outer membrane protein [Vicinamibacteria bacterium]|nr:BamA/TamA family outer membrane protein [Vicinamibacteria bacterium]
MRRLAGGVLACLLSALSAPGLAQESAPSIEPSPRPDETPGTRAHEWRQLRERRFATIEPYRPGFLERQILAFEKAERPSILYLNFAGLYPRFQSIAQGSRTAAGLRFWQPDIGGSRLDAHASAFYSIHGYEYYDVQFGRLPHTGKQFPLRSSQGLEVYELGNMPPAQRAALILYGAARYQHYTRIGYYGPGPDSRREDETTFLDQRAFYELVAGLQLSPHFSLTARGGYVQAFVGPGEDDDVPTTQELFTDEQAPGLDEQPDFLLVSGQAFWDRRDKPGNPHNGVMAALQISHLDDRGGEEFGFTRFAGDVRGFVPLGSVQRTLALRGYLSSDNADSGGRVPFYAQQTLGGSHTLRGFPNFRFRDTKVFLLQAEYRWEASPAIELALFADAGRVAPRIADVFSNLELDAGAGLRLKTNLNTVFRVDVARSREGWHGLARFSQGF